MVDSRRQRSFSDVVVARRSVRRYQPLPVPAEAIERLLEAAIWAPSPHNRQPWRFVVLQEQEDRKQLAGAMGGRLRADRLADGDDPQAVEADVAGSYARITGAAAVILVFLTMEDMDVYPDARRSRAEHLMAVQAVAMAVDNLLLAAEAEGLGACWMCAPLFCSETVLEILSLPPHWEAQALVSLGYPASRGKPARRRLLADVLRARS